MKVAASALVLFCASLSVAQTEQRPFCYLTGRLGQQLPSPGSAPNVSQMVVALDVDVNPVDVVLNQVINRIVAQTSTTPPATDPQHIAILFHSFGEIGPNSSVPARTSFYHELDKVNVSLPPTAHPSLPYMQPWMTHGIGKVHDWIVDFLQAYPEPPFPVPARFHFDVEDRMTGCCDVAHMLVAAAVAADGRWNNLPVPGFEPPKTMAQLYQDARDQYGFTSETFAGAINTGQPPSSIANRPYMMWYYSVCQRAFDAAMEQALYTPIKYKWPNCLVSNYEDINADGKEDDFGWYHGKDSNSNPATVIRGVRGGTTIAHEGRHNQWMGTAPFKRMMWMAQEGTASGDFSAPVLYLHHPLFSSWSGPSVSECCDPTCYTPNMINPYLPPLNDQNKLSIYDASLIVHRRTVEGILNSDNSGNDPGKIAPWMMALNMVPGSPSSACHTVTRPYLIDQLAMLRAKRVGEMMIWWDENQALTIWQDFNNILDVVYKPKLLWVSFGHGTPAPGTTPHPDQARWTLRPPCQFGVAEAMEIDSAVVNTSNVVEIYASFSDSSGVGQVRFNLECAVDDPDVRGRVYALGGAGWTQVKIPDFDDQTEEFGFFTPVDPNGNVYRTRRTFQVPSYSLLGDQLIIKLVLHKNGINPGAFRASFDLLQVVGTGENAENPGGDDSSADFDYSGDVTSGDLAAFYTAWQSQSPAADSNGDGTVDATDLALYLQKYVQ